MRKICILALLAIVVSCKTSDEGRSVFTGHDKGEMQLVWSDEFDCDGAPDPEKWVYETGYVRNKEPQYYQKANAVCKDGFLTIEARMEDGRLTSASIETKGKASFLYGRIEASMKIPTGPSAWPAFWTVGSTRHWPDCGEIDIMEFYRYGGEASILGNGFWVAEDGENVLDDTGVVPFSYFTEQDPDWADKFHVWAMDWDEDLIRIYVDDTLVNEIDLSKTFNVGGKHIGENPLRQPQLLKLNLALRGRENDPVVEEALPMRFIIDYVRVYQKK